MNPEQNFARNIVPSLEPQKREESGQRRITSPEDEITLLFALSHGQFKLLMGDEPSDAQRRAELMKLKRIPYDQEVVIEVPGKREKVTIKRPNN